ncbi:holo-ACP synthase [Streptomyces sp. NPDC002514]|uniref:holo-ACP synthase n=1 Tax=unclassified Streptomyces TaxID=2593676 RepID=UPI0036BF9A0D
MWIGVDLLRAGELDRLLGRRWFREFTYDPAELAQAEEFGPERAREYLVGRFAGKESVLKVLGTGFTSGVKPRQVAILRTPLGAPEVHLTGTAAARARELGVAEIRVSITHKSDLAMAVALGLPAARPGCTCETSAGSSVTMHS